LNQKAVFSLLAATETTFANGSLQKLTVRELIFHLLFHSFMLANRIKNTQFRTEFEAR